MDRNGETVREPVTSGWTYVIVGVVLLVLAGLTTALAFVDLHAWNTVAALGIAAVKAALIMLFFMRLRVDSPLIRLVAVGGLVWFGIMLGGTLDDVLTRGWLPVPGK